MEVLKEILLVFTVLLCCISQGTPCPAADAPDTEGKTLTETLAQTLTASFKAEEKALDTARERLIQARRDRVYMTAAANGYRIQLSSFGNLLLSEGVDLPTLQKNRSALRSSLEEIRQVTQDLAPETEKLAREQETLDRQLELTDKQIRDLTGLYPQNKAAPALLKTARQLKTILEKKRKIFTELAGMYASRLADLLTVEHSFSELGGRFDTTVEQRRAKSLFERQGAGTDISAALRDDATRLAALANRLFSLPFWTDGARRMWQSTGPAALSLALVLAAALLLLRRIRTHLVLSKLPDRASSLGPRHHLAAVLLILSVIPGGVGIILLIYSGLSAMALIAPALRTTGVLILVFLAAGWFVTALSDEAVWMTGDRVQAKRLIRLSKGTALFCLLDLPVTAVLGQNTPVPAALRLAASFGLVVWTFTAWREVKLLELMSRHGDTRLTEGSRPMGLGCKALLALIGVTALVLDMTGFGSLSAYWLISWGKTAPILLGWGICFALLREWDRHYREKSRARQNELLYDDYPVQWLLIRAGQLVWLVSLAVALLLAWGSRRVVLEKVYLFLAHPVTVGSMAFSFMGIIYAVLVILATFAVAKIWRWGFQSKFLSQSGMGIGLQDAITTITVYVIWTFGILVSLHVFGLNTASLAVAFGALGIGLGFGLQNIFNNFISGIILLFERPIQVGDDVEINGTWAQVKKINVRSTVVQTYDNASLIIPNADFISGQVTNWSFKDKRIRRRITLGVAYGSDTALVRDSLLEIAANAPKVLKYPRPDVLFQDFGDSALIFTLRVWTDIDSMLSVETQIRFEIDRMFRERAIEISFPQRDIHIRSVPDRAPDAAAKAGLPVEKEEKNGGES